MIPSRVLVYGACSSSMSAIINPIIYMNTNKTFKKFVVNLLKCKHAPNSGITSTAVVSQCRDQYTRLSTNSSVNSQSQVLRDLYKKTGLAQPLNASTKRNTLPTFRNPSAVAETRVMNNSTCAVGYNQNGPQFNANSDTLNPDHGYRRSKSDVTVPGDPNHLHPKTKRSRAGDAKKRITFHGFDAAECPESNENAQLSAESDGTSDSERQSDNSDLKSSLKSADSPASKAKKTVRLSPRVRALSDNSVNSTSLKGENGTLVSRSLDSFTDSSSGSNINNVPTSPEFEFRNRLDLATDPLSVVKPSRVSFVSDDEDDTTTDDESHAEEIDMKGRNNPALSPVENPEKTKPERTKLNDNDFYND